MRLRLRWLAPFVALGAVMLPAGVAAASAGIGIQAGPVQLAGRARPGGSYPLPPVYVINTGSGPETITLRVERISAGNGRTIPPSWIAGKSRPVTLAPDQSASVPLTLVVPGTARPGRYFSDVVAVSEPGRSADSVGFGVAAATDLEFTVASGPGSGPWFSLPGWLVPSAGGLLVLAAAVFGWRRSGLRIRIERDRPPRAGSASASGWRAVISVTGAALVLAAVAGCGTVPTAPAGSVGSGSITLKLHTVKTTRNVSVGPAAGAFGTCTGGLKKYNTPSKTGQLGYPNGRCEFPAPKAALIKITNTGIAGHIEVNGNPAVPSDPNGQQWALCNVGSQPPVACTGTGRSRPGKDQYLLQNFGPGGLNRAGLTGTPQCDREFRASHSCWVMQGAASFEGLDLTGPAEATDHLATTWTVVVTWTAAP